MLKMMLKKVYKPMLFLKILYAVVIFSSIAPEPDYRTLRRAISSCEHLIIMTNDKEEQVLALRKEIDKYIKADRKARSTNPDFVMPDYIEVLYALAEKVSGIEVAKFRDRFAQSSRLFAVLDAAQARKDAAQARKNSNENREV